MPGIDNGLRLEGRASQIERDNARRGRAWQSSVHKLLEIATLRWFGYTPRQRLGLLNHRSSQ